MKREIRDQWCAELRSGKRKQGFGKLEDINGRQCYLGVLADVCGVPKRYSEYTGAYLYEFINKIYSSENSPPAGFQGLTASQISRLITLSDDKRLSFPKIANWIEQNIPVEG